MVLFESTLVLMLVAIVLLQLSRRLDIPYPTMLAVAGVVGRAHGLGASLQSRVLCRRETQGPA